MQSKNFFYHIKPDKLIGNKLVPSSKLPENIDKSNKEKYKDRKELIKKEVPILDVSWDEVIFFSCLNPVIILTALELLGLSDKNSFEILKFPIEVLVGREFCYFLEDNDGKENFKKLDIKKYQEEKILPYETAKYFVECVKTGEDPLIFSCVPHILLKGELDIHLAETVKYQPLI